MFMLYTDAYWGNPFISAWLFYVIYPLLDIALPLDNKNISQRLKKQWEKDWRFLIPLYSVWLLDFGIYFYILWQVSIGAKG